MNIIPRRFHSFIDFWEILKEIFNPIEILRTIIFSLITMFLKRYKMNFMKVWGSITASIQLYSLASIMAVFYGGAGKSSLIRSCLSVYYSISGLKGSEQLIGVMSIFSGWEMIEQRSARALQSPAVENVRIRLLNFQKFLSQRIIFKWLSFSSITLLAVIYSRVFVLERKKLKLQPFDKNST